MATTPTFGPKLERLHRRVDSARWDDIYVVGDVHGCLDAVERLLDRIDPSDEDLVVFVGDLVRKGPDSAGVVELVAERPNFLSVRGNNEQKLIDGRKTLDSLSSADYEFLESLPVALSWDDTLVVHGGIDHREPVEDHTLTDLLNTRSLAPGGSYDRPYWFETRRERPRVFFGHTVLSEPFVADHAVGLDTGCVYGGALTAFDYRADGLIAVEPRETHVSRDADSIVDPRLADPVSCDAV
ncbi:metallophosphoesterase family protein [Halobellus rarus]|uniref:Metallophosphoesterase family protein n=1 Tax=Halobellus rarus TaxID=1126237 RepID=A0ABD6CLS4_9EURY|nr:metallophosphoesterase family protein [Halobellus rarus]